MYIYVGLQYQEDLKIRAMNDVTARKDQEHLQVKLISNRNNQYFYTNYFFLNRK